MYYTVFHNMDAEARTGVTTVLGLTDPRDTLKALRETLCLAQTALANDFQEATHGGDLADAPGVIANPRPDTEPWVIELCQDYVNATERIGRIIAEIDRQRPLGPDGKHGDRHTSTCGCEDL